MQRHAGLTIFLAVFLTGAIVRLLVVFVVAPPQLHDATLPDETQYWSMAQGLNRGQGLVDELGFRATRMPLYPAFLALFAGRSNGYRTALCVQAVLGALACGFVSLLAIQVGRSVGWSSTGATGRGASLCGLTAGVLVAIDPFLAYYSRFLLTEGIFISAFSAFMLFSYQDVNRKSEPNKVRWVFSGLTFALCVYLRPSCSAFLALWSVLIFVRGGVHRRTMVQISCLWAILMLALLPWAIRNKTITGHWTWLTNRAGISLYDGVHPGATGASNLGEIKQTPAVRGLDEVAWNAYFTSQSWRHITAEPLRIARLAPLKLARTWSPWPNAEGYRGWQFRLIGGLWSVVVLVSALLGIVQLRKSKATALALLTPLLYFSALHMVFVGSLRYRLPAVPMVEVLSAVGIAGVIMPRRPGTTDTES